MLLKKPNELGLTNRNDQFFFYNLVQMPQVLDKYVCFSKIFLMKKLLIYKKNQITAHNYFLSRYR